MRLITDKFWVRFFFFSALLAGSYNFLGQSLSFSYVQGYFGITSQDANWLLRGFQSGTIITGIAGLVFIKWFGNRNLFIGAFVFFLVATFFSFTAKQFNILLVARVAAGIANGFIIAVGAYVIPLTDEAMATAKKIGVVSVDMNGTACTVPDVGIYIAKVAARGSLGKKKKTVKC